MPQLTETLKAWGTPACKEILKTEIESLDAEQLPLQQGMAQSSYVSDEPFRAMIISLGEQDQGLQAKVGVFYSGIIAGCNCADDPTPVDVQPEYCVVQVDIDRDSAEASFRLSPE